MRLRGRVLTSPEYAKELRLFRLQPLLLSQWRELFQTTFHHMQNIRRKGHIRSSRGHWSAASTWVCRTVSSS